MCSQYKVCYTVRMVDVVENPFLYMVNDLVNHPSALDLGTVPLLRVYVVA